MYTTSKGPTYYSASIAKKSDGSRIPLPLIIVLRRSDLIPANTFADHTGKEAFITFNGKRLDEPNGSVVLFDLDHGTYEVIKGKTWTVEMFDNKKISEFVEQVVDEL